MVSAINPGPNDIAQPARPRAPLEIVDQPAFARCLLHPAQKFHDQVVGHMVRDQTADHEVNRHGWREIENVHHAIADFVGIVGDCLRNADGLAVEVEPDEPDRQAAA